MSSFTIDEILKLFLLTGDEVLKSSGLKQKVVWDVQYVKHPEYPFRVRLTIEGKNYNLTLPRKIKLKEFQTRFSELIDNVKKDFKPSLAI